MKKIRVLVFVNSFRIGGSERQAVELVKGLDRSRFEPILACFQKDGPLSEELPEGLHGVEAFPLSGFFNSNALRQAARLYQLCRVKKVQVVQCFNYYSNVFAIPVARLARVPVILGCRREEAVARTAMHQLLERWSYRLATGVVANAQAIKDQVVEIDGIPADKVWVIHNGLDVNRFGRQGLAMPGGAVRKNGRVVIAVVANLRPEKGHLVFLEAAKLVSSAYPESTFLIVGEGPMRDEIESRIGQLQLAARVEMRGAVKDIPSLLRSSVDIAVLPSLKNEGFPNAVMEAMGASLPVVATDTGGTRELVVDGMTGFLVRPGDPAALADRIAKFCGDRELRMKMGEAGRRRVLQEFSVDRMARKFEDLYTTLLK